MACRGSNLGSQRHMCAICIRAKHPMAGCAPGPSARACPCSATLGWLLQWWRAALLPDRQAMSNGVSLLGRYAGLLDLQCGRGGGRAARSQ
jgi:hypothetical protein